MNIESDSFYLSPVSRVVIPLEFDFGSADWLLTNEVLHCCPSCLPFMIPSAMLCPVAIGVLSGESSCLDLEAEITMVITNTTLNAKGSQFVFDALEVDGHPRFRTIPVVCVLPIMIAIR